MNRRILKLITVILLLVTLTFANFISVGMGLVSYAASDISTNHPNVKFDANMKENHILVLNIEVQKEGYFNGEVTLENSNFKLKSSESAYVNNIEGNKITLNQINSGTNAQIEIEVEPISEEIFDEGLLTMSSSLKLTGTYHDSTERDRKIEAIREVVLEYKEDNTSDNMENSAEVITNKVLTVNGEEKRVVQISMNLGLKENNYPIKEIYANLKLLNIDEKEIKTAKNITFNTMTHSDYEFKDSQATFHLTNEPNKENKILWKKQGNEKVVLTLLLDKEIALENATIETEQTLNLYNGKELKANNTLTIGNEEKNSIIEVQNSYVENSIYKGKLYASIERNYQEKTNIVVNLANATQNITAIEENNKYIVNEKETQANSIYRSTIISKEEFDKILGQNGNITISNEKGETLAVITTGSEVNENNQIVVNYEGKEPQSLQIKTSMPISEGSINFIHNKALLAQDKTVISNATELKTKVDYQYDANVVKSHESKIKIEESRTEATFELNKQDLSTVIENNVEIKATLKNNNEQYNLWENPTVVFTMPEEVESVRVNSIDLMYENELKITNYQVNGRNIVVNLEGKQTSYQEAGIEGSIVILNVDINVNRKSATKDSQIVMMYQNQNITGQDTKAIKIVAPTNMTVIHNVKDLGIQTIGEEKSVKAALQRGTDAKTLVSEIEVINNYANAIENVNILGDFPTKNTENNINISVTTAIQLQGVEGATIYYTENESANTDLNNPQNGWTNEITNGNLVKKYLIVIPKMESQASVYGTYSILVPANLEYNQTAKQSYQVQYSNGLTRATNEMKATEIDLETGVGPILETKLTASKGNNTLTNQSTVKNGEVIKYTIEIANTGSEEIHNVNVKANVPDGTTMVVPQDYYEYTGSTYYKELENRTYENTIETIKVGEVVTTSYEVRVNSDIAEGTKLTNQSQIRYGDVDKTSDASELTTTKGNIRVSVKRVTDRSIDLYESGTIQYYAIIENISSEKQENVKVKTNLPESLEVERLMLITGMESLEDIEGEVFQPGDIEEEYIDDEYIDDENTSQDTEESNYEEEVLEYKEEINIGSIEPKETKVLSYDMLIGKVDNSKEVNFSVVAIDNGEEYQSNNTVDNVKKVNIGLSMETNTESQYVKAGDNITYRIIVENKEKEDVAGILISDTIPESLTVNKVKFDGEEIPELAGENIIQVSCDIAGEGRGIIEIETVVNHSEARTQSQPISNVAYAEWLGERIAATTQINHIIMANETENPNDSDPSGSSSENNDVATGKNMVSGMAWFDENANGAKDDNEQVLQNIKVHLLNPQTNHLVKTSSGNTLEATTNKDGLYVLDNIKTGKYIVLFEYDNEQYTVTKYKANGVEENKNSNVMINEITIENEKQKVASTDILEISNENISNINIGLIKLQNFDLKLEKFVSKILIQNSTGTTVKEYNNATLAKAELDAKKISGTTVVVEYKIKVSNVGEVNGYVKRITDYMPNDFRFSAELNKDWYQTAEGIHNISLANDVIKAGESKEVTLTLTKTMTENNTGRSNNTAEISESYNELGIEDSNSIPGNRVQGENDTGSADVILSIRTGGMVYVGAIITTVVILGIVAGIVIYRKKSDRGI